MRFHPRERAGLDVAGADARRELAPFRVVLRRQRAEHAVDDPERIERNEHPKAQPVVVERGEDLGGEELLDRLGELLRGRPLAHVTPFASSRWQISYSTSAPRRPRIASSTLRSWPVRWRRACVTQPIAHATLPATSQ